MDLNNYFTNSDGKFRFSRQQASRFAKNIAGDYNPIHDQDNKRFCVPGDLLFAVVLKSFGISETMKFEFSGMVSDKVQLEISTDKEGKLSVFDEKDKLYLSIHRSGKKTENITLINHLIQAYVGFSGQTFPHVLVPLMEKHQMMINTDRPLVIYNSMTIEINDFNVTTPSLELVDSNMTIQGKRGDVCLRFNFTNAGKIIGKGEKNMLLSSLREYNETKIRTLVETYNKRKMTLTE